MNLLSRKKKAPEFWSFFSLKVFLWNRWDSNPRPNKEQINFLHAYLLIDFRLQPGQKQPNYSLAFLVSPINQGCLPTSSEFDTSYSGVTKQPPREILVHTTIIRVELSFYRLAIKQRVRNLFRQLWLVHCFKGQIHNALHAYLPTRSCCQNLVGPIF